jgi:hypothetical protein
MYLKNKIEAVADLNGYPPYCDDDIGLLRFDLSVIYRSLKLDMFYKDLVTKDRINIAYQLENGMDSKVGELMVVELNRLFKNALDKNLLDKDGNVITTDKLRSLILKGEWSCDIDTHARMSIKIEA